MLKKEEKALLLRIAREAIGAGVAGRIPDKLPWDSLPESIRENGACFVTLTMHGSLRGCIGSLEARQPLVLDVQEHALDAALHDFRFEPVLEAEVALLHIEISILTQPIPLQYARPDELPSKLHPMKDGVILGNGARKATYLPQVWEQLPDPQIFLSSLCEKMGAEPDLWRKQLLQVQIYHVDCFEED